MIFYSDENTRNYEKMGDWIDCIQFLHNKWCSEKENKSLFLKLAVNIWYTLSIDGLELSLTKSDRDYLFQRLVDAFTYFSVEFKECDTCEWLFGYMMIVRPDFFLNSGFEYDLIESKGLKLIEKAKYKNNMFALLIYAKDHFPSRKVSKCCLDVKSHINDYFNDKEIVDSYFIEVLTSVFQ